MINYTSSEAESDSHLYIQLLKDGILETLEALLPSDKLMAQSFQDILQLVSHICVTNEQSRDLILRSKCYELILQRYPGFASPQIHHQMSWLFGNLIRQNKTCRLSTEISIKLLNQLKLTMMKSNHAEIANHTVYGMSNFLCDASTRQERLQIIFGDSFWHKFLQEYISTELKSLRDMIIEVLALCSEYTGHQNEWLVHHSIISELIKFLKTNKGAREEIHQWVWRYLTNVIAHCPGNLRAVIRNDQELFRLASEVLLPDSPDITKICALDFIRTCFLVLEPEHGRNVLIANPDLVVEVIGVLADYDEGDQVRQSLVMALLEALQVLLRFGRNLEEDLGDNPVKQRIENANENEVLDRMARGLIGNSQQERDFIQYQTKEVLSEFFEWHEE